MFDNYYSIITIRGWNFMDGDSDAVTVQGSADQYTKFEKDLSYCF